MKCAFKPNISVFNKNLVIDVKPAYHKDYAKVTNNVINSFINDLEEITIKKLIDVPADQLKDINKFFIMSFDSNAILSEIKITNKNFDYILFLKKIYHNKVLELILKGWMSENTYKRVIGNDFKNIIIKFFGIDSYNVAILLNSSITVYDLDRYSNHKSKVELKQEEVNYKKKFNCSVEDGLNEFIYIFTNKYMSCIKIGRTKDISKRIVDLSRSTGVPGDFELYYKRKFRNASKVESYISKYFKIQGYKIEKKEFYTIPKDIARDFISSIDEDQIY